jgi:Rrf2 family protein
MKFSAQEEYGLRCLVQVARSPRGLTIPQVSQAEGIPQTHAAKLLRILRTGGFLNSARGQVGGYTLARPASEIAISDVLAALGGRLFSSDFCRRHTGAERACSHNADCSIRSLWSTVQDVVDRVLSRTTLEDLLADGSESGRAPELVRLEPAPPVH